MECTVKDLRIDGEGCRNISVPRMLRSHVGVRELIVGNCGVKISHLWCLWLLWGVGACGAYFPVMFFLLADCHRRAHYRHCE